MLSSAEYLSGMGEAQVLRKKRKTMVPAENKTAKISNKSCFMRSASDARAIKIIDEIKTRFKIFVPADDDRNTLNLSANNVVTSSSSFTI